MTRKLFILAHDQARINACRYIEHAPANYRVEIKPPKRSLDQNDYMWALLGDIASQATINGKHYNDGQWKCIFMKALGHEVDFLPTIDGAAFFPTGFRSSDLGKSEMNALIEYIIAEGIKRGVKFHDGKDLAA